VAPRRTSIRRRLSRAKEVGNVDHTIVHFEIPADDTAKLRTFYSKLFGWKIEKIPGFTEYWSIETVPVDEQGRLVRPGVNGGLMKRQSPEHELVTYIAVESVDEYSQKVVELGGTITVPKQEIPGIGWWVFARDPDGNQFGLFQSK
jgi:predicted enzyme related to lactoylglutathione lyase